jgi:hypothetical protein
MNSKFKIQDSRLQFKIKVTMTTNETTVGGTAGRTSKNGRGSRALFVDCTSHKLGSYPFHHQSGTSKLSINSSRLTINSEFAICGKKTTG